MKPMNKATPPTLPPGDSAASTPRKMKFLSAMMADHTGSKIEKEAKDRQSSVVSVNRMMLSGSNRKSTKGKNTVKDKPEAEVKKKKRSRHKPFPRKGLWSWSMDAKDLVNDVTTLEDPLSSKMKDGKRRAKGRRGSTNRNTTKGHRGSARRMHSFRAANSGINHRGSMAGTMKDLISIEEMMQEEMESQPRREIDVQAAKLQYILELEKCLLTVGKFPHNKSPPTSESEEEESEEDSSEEEEGGGDNFAASSTFRTPFMGIGNDDHDDTEFQNLTPQKIMEDLSNTHSGKGNKEFRAAHALSMRRKLSSYHRNGIPNTMRGRTGRRGSKFEGSKFMNSRRLSQRIGLEANDQAALQELANHLSGGKVSDLDRPESESESEDEEGTTADQAEHYHSYHLYSIFEQLHSPGVSGRPGSARTNYLRKCEEEQTAPLPIFDHIRQTPSGLVDMKLSRYGIGDHATVAFGEFLKHCPLKVNSLEVAHNSIMNRGMTILLRSISAHQLIKFLDISSNSPKRSSIVALTDLFLQPEPIRLVDLRLSNCNIGDRNMMILAEGIGESSTLETLKLDKNNLTMCGRDIAYILHENDILTDLDLSWNQFRNEEAAIIARCLIGNETMTSLDLSYNHFGFDSAIFSISKFVTDSEVIQHLDVSYNSVKERGSMCMADALKVNDSVKELIMDGNPVGPKGGRELLKMMANDGNMRVISLENCNFEMPDDGPIPFDINEPNGFYKLDLSVPYDRMIAKSLQELAYTQGGECWRGEKIDGVVFDFPEDDPMAWDVPEEGILELAFVSNKPLENSEMNESQFEIIKNQINKKGKQDENKAQGLISQLSNTFAFNSSQVGEIIENFENSTSKVSVATRLFTQVTDTNNAEKLLSKLNQLERKQVEKKLGQFYYFNNRNPTGHYRLNLNQEYERLVATRIADVNKIEKLSSRMEGKMDLTQKGNWDNMRNETYNGEPFAYNTNWEIPESGILEFDYVSTVRPESEAMPMSDYEFELFFREYITLEGGSEDVDEEELKEIFLQFDDDGGGTVDVEELGMIMKSLGQVMTEKEVETLFNDMDDDGSGSIEFDEFLDLWEIILHRVKEQDRLITLRRQSANVFVSAEQVAMMLKRIFNPLERIELFVIFFCRLVDEENMHTALCGLSQEEKEALMHRVGPLNLFNPFQPDGRYTLDLAQHDTYLLATILIKLGIGESGKAIHDESYNGFAFTLPASWTKVLPKKGVYELTFRTPAPGERRKTRKTMASMGKSSVGRSTIGNKGLAREAAAAVAEIGGGDNEKSKRGSSKGKEGPSKGKEGSSKVKERSTNVSFAPETSSRSPIPIANTGGTKEGDRLRGDNMPTMLKQGNMVGGVFLSTPGKGDKAHPGNTKLRRSVAERYLGWEFMEDEDENDLSSQHEALSRRRSSMQKVVNTDDIRDTLIRTEREKKEKFGGGAGGWGDEEPTELAGPAKVRGRSERRAQRGSMEKMRTMRGSFGRSTVIEGEENTESSKRRTKWEAVNRQDTIIKKELLGSMKEEVGLQGIEEEKHGIRSRGGSPRGEGRGLALTPRQTARKL